MKTPVLKTDRLILRPAALTDAPAIQKYFNNWNIVQYLSMAVPWPYPDDGAETFLRDILLPEIETGKAHAWVLTQKDDPAAEPIGLISYHTELKDDRGNRGFWLAEPFWKRGYMTEAVTAVNDFLFFELGIDRMVVTNIKTNEGSRRVKEKTGARFLGNIKVDHRNGESESEQWEVTRESWEASRG